MSNGGAARQLTDDRFILDARIGGDSRSEPSASLLSYESFVRRYAPPDPESIPWHKEVKRRLYELTELAPGWDSYGAPAISPDAVSFAFELLGKVMRFGTPPPQIVPSSVGGVQIEWHMHDLDLEIHIVAAYRCEMWYKNYRLNQIIDQEVNADFSPLSVPIKELSQY